MTQTLSQEAESAGMNRGLADESFCILYTLADVFMKHECKIEPIYHETLISRPTLRKHLKEQTLDTILFIRCPDGSVNSFFQKQPSKYAK